METEDRIVRKRTRVPAITNDKIKRVRREIKKYTLDEITENLSDTDKANLLKNGTEIQGRLINQKRDSLAIGKLLFENKKILPHGMFTPWIESYFGKELPYSTAYFYMNIYDLFQDNPRAIDYIPTTYLLMITNKEFPIEIVKALKEDPENIQRLALQEIKDNFALFKSGEIGSNQFIKLSKSQIKMGLDLLKGGGKHRINASMRHSLEYGAGDILKRINELREIAHQMAGLYPYDPDCYEHKELIKAIKDTIHGLIELKHDLEGGKGFIKPISTPEGDKWIENI
jgi:hypothetical protein